MHLVFSQLSEQLTTSLLNDDFTLYRSVFRLPEQIEPRDGNSYLIETDEALRRDLELYVAAMRIHRITGISRDIVSIVELADDWSEVTTLTSLFSQGGVVVDTDAGRRTGAVRSSLGHISWTLGRATIENNKFRLNRPETAKD